MNYLKQTLLALLILNVNITFAQTISFSGNISSNTTWSADTVKILGNVQVNDHVTLTIKPGTYVEFQGYCGLTVLGRILALGEADDTITFTVNDTSGYHNNGNISGGWCSIFFTGSPLTNDTSKFNYCKFTYCKNQPVSSYPGFNIIIERSLFYNNYSGIFFSSGGNPIIRYNTFKKIQGTAISFNDNCNPVISQNLITGCGCGILGSNSTTEIKDNIISGCSSFSGITIDGGISTTIIKNEISYNIYGGLYISNSSNNLVADNYIEYNGHGLYVDNSNSVIMNNIIAYNTSDGGGSGLFLKGPELLVIFNKICNNQATGYGCGYSDGGAGIMCINASPFIINNIISNNESESIGAGICMLDSVAATLVNNTIVNNKSNQSDGGGVYINTQLSTKFDNNIIWGNEATTGNQMKCFSNNNTIHINYCNIGDTLDVSPYYSVQYNHIVTNNPVFTSPSAYTGAGYDGLNADWSLRSNSPCINAGAYDTTGLHLQNTDMSGNARVIGSRIDIGAYEFEGMASTGSLAANGHNEDIYLYPNPARGYVNLTVMNTEQQELQLRITDIAGKTILNERIARTSSFLNEMINLTSYPRGIYNVAVTDNKGDVNSKMLAVE